MSTKKRFSPGRIWDRLRTVPGLGRDVSAIAIALVITLVAGGILLSRTQFDAPWQDEMVVWAEFNQAPAVNPNSTQIVTIAGVEVGAIRDWKVTDQGRAKLKLVLEPGHQIYSNAHAVLRAVNPLNEMYVEIDPGGPPAAVLPGGGTIPASQTRRPVQADEALANLDERTQSAVTDLLVAADTALARFPEHLPPGLDATTDTVVEIRPVVESLQTRRNLIGELVTALARISTAVGSNHDRLTGLADAMQRTLGVLAENDKALRASLKQLPGLSDQLRNALTDTQQLTDQLDPTLVNLNRAAEELPPALERLTETVNEAGNVVDVAKPVVAKARPAVADLRPFVANTDVALDDLVPVTARLDRDTKILVSYLTDLQAFVYNTSSVFGTKDGQGGFIRGHVIATLPDGGLLPDANGYAPSPEESGYPARKADNGPPHPEKTRVPASEGDNR